MLKILQIVVPAVAVAAGSMAYMRTKFIPIPEDPKAILKGYQGWVELKLTNIGPIAKDAKIYTFSFPEPNQTSGVIVASSILAKAVTSKGKNVVRPYTPISNIEKRGSFDLMVKSYKDGNLSAHFDAMKVNDTLQFMGPLLRWKWEPNKFEEIGLIGGGSGITPLYQIIQHVLGNNNDRTKITLLYGSKTVDDILLKPQLDELASKYPDKFKLKYFVGTSDTSDLGDNISIGHIDKKELESNLPKPSSNSQIFICGPPAMLKSISGSGFSPVAQGPLGGILKELGYKSSEIFRF